MLQIIISVLVIILLILVFKYFTGKNKPSDQRGSLEKFACTIFTIFRGNINDATNSLRTATVMKQEAMAEVEDAINKLNASFKTGQTEMRIACENLEKTILPNLKDQPGKLEAKARQAKKDYENSVAKGHPIEQYKKNAMMFIKMKNQAFINIDKSEKNLEKLKVSIETSKAEYDANITELNMIKTELATTVDIPRAELNSSLDRIQSLQTELNNRMNLDRISAEVSSEMRESDLSSSSDSNDEEEYNNL